VPGHAAKSKRAPPALRPNFGSLFWPLTRNEFLATYWERRHFVSHASAGRLAAIERDLGQLDIEVLAAGCKSVKAWSSKRSGRPRFIATNADDALDLYCAGMTLYLWNMEALQPWVRGLSSELGALGRGVGSLFASPAGASLGFHFDRDELFTIQLRGRKRWRVAPNDQVRSPDTGWVTGAPVPERLRLYCSEELPKEGPREFESFELAPGSVLYLPQGYWHATETIEDSLSVELGLALPTWADLVIDAMRTLLLSREEWRERALGAWGNQRQRSDARRQLGNRIERLGQELARLQAGDLVETSPRNLAARAADFSTRYRRNPLTAFGIEDTAGSDNERIATVRVISNSLLQVKTKEYELDAGSVELCRWIASQTAPFTGEDARDAVGTLSDDELAGLLEALAEAGLIRLAENR
jgi:50S ribosomal protein L16 3-hydroxylase